MEGYLFQRINHNDSPQRQAKYLSKYCNPVRHPLEPAQPLVLPPNEPPPSHLEIIEKCTLQFNHIRKIKELQIDQEALNDENASPVSEGVLRRFKILKRVFKRTLKAEQVFIDNHSRKSSKKVVSSYEARRSDSTKFCPPPFGYYDSKYTQVQKRIPSMNISKQSRQSSRVESMTPTVDVNYQAIYPRPMTFNMCKQLPRDRSLEPKSQVEPDIRMLQSQFEFNFSQQKKYPMSIPAVRLKVSLDKKIFPYSLGQINSKNIDILKKYNFNQNDKKFGFLKKLPKNQ